MLTKALLSEKSESHLRELVTLVNRRLDEYMSGQLAAAEPAARIAAEAMEYSVAAGGKRLRPVLLLEFCRLCGGDTEQALPAACALEMIHTFSLIHDDLPCMDDDDMRRGKPSCHAAFGEANALLAGDGLLNLAFGTLCGGELPPERKIALMGLFSREVGIGGMIGGQVIDTTYTGEITEETLLKMYSMKTSALLKAACVGGCTAAGAGTEKLAAAEIYAEKLGLAFQIVDDILDAEGDEALLGKPVGSDSEKGKVTYFTLCGGERSRKAAESLTNGALTALEPFGDTGETDFLRELTLFLLKRDH